ncbi:MAG: hypothetical protein OHK0015_10460 [Chloroflexi bacterium OHK40]
MSYRFTNTPVQPTPNPRAIMTGLLLAFVVVSLLVFLAGRVPFVPSVTPLSGPTYRDYVVPAREQLSTYGRNPDGTVRIPIDRAMDLIVERGLPTRDNPSPTP